MQKPERLALERLISNPGTMPRHSQRARIALLAGEGATNREIAEQTGASLPTISLWRRRYLEQGISGLKDRPRGGRPRSLLADQASDNGNDQEADAASEVRERLFAAAARTIARRGLSATRVADIAHEAGVSAATVHYHLATKEEILVNALLWANERLTIETERVIASSADPIAGLAVLIERSIPYDGVQKDEYLLEIDLWSQVRQHPELLPAWERYDELWIDTVTKMIQSGIDAGVFTCRIDASEIVERLVAMTDGLAAQTAIGSERMPAERVRSLVLEFAAEQVGIEVSALDIADRLSLS